MQDYPKGFEESDFEIEFGILNSCSDECELEVVPTRSLPKKIDRENMRFGFLIKPRTCARYTTQVFLTTPIVGGGNNLVSEVFAVSGTSSAGGFLESGDTTGTYQMSLHINGELASELDFQVQ